MTPCKPTVDYRNRLREGNHLLLQTNDSRLFAQSEDERRQTSAYRPAFNERVGVGLGRSLLGNKHRSFSNGVFISETAASIHPPTCA
jgi:hypothetical protein